MTWRVISRWRNARESLAWWQRILGAGFNQVRPFLTACPGQRCTHYPCPVTGIPLTVAPARGGFVAFATGEEADALDDVSLTWEQVQVWRLDVEGLSADLAKVLQLDAVPADGEQDLIPLGRCPRHPRVGRVLLNLAGDPAASLGLLSGLPGRPDVGCVVNPQRWEPVEALLRAAGRGSVVLEESVQITANGLRGGCCETCRLVERDLSNRELKQHLDGRLDRVGREVGEMAAENELLKRRLADVLGHMVRQVEPEFLGYVFTILGSGSIGKAAQALGKPKSTLHEELGRYQDRGGLYPVLYSLAAVRRKGLGTGTVEHFNEMLARHQPHSSPIGPSLWQDLLNGLEALNATNWSTVRNELITLLREADPDE